MDLKQLEHFVVVAEERHFTRAAHRLELSQSTVSGSIQRLEREVGHMLLARTSRRVELTPAGHALLPEARRAVHAADAARAAIAAFSEGLGGKVSVGTGKALPPEYGDAFLRFASDHPGIELELRQGGSMELIEAVSDGRLDFAPLGLPGELPARLRERVALIETAAEEMVLACSGSHRFAGHKTVSLADLTDERFADLTRDWAIRLVNDRAFAHVGPARRLAFELNDVDALLDVVALDLAVAVLPVSAARRSSRLRCIALSPPAPTWRLGFAVPAGRPPSPAALALFQTMAPGVEWPMAERYSSTTSITS